MTDIGDPFMAKGDFDQARWSRERQVVVYPDMRQETEESKLKGRAARRQRVESLNKKRGLMMVEPKFDIGTGKISFPKPEAKAAAVAEEMTYISIPKTLASKLVGYARADGADLSADTDKGKQVKATKAARLYVLLAIGMLTAKRG